MCSQPDDSTAQDAYRALLNGHISPALRELGFKGSAGRYHRPSDTHWSLLELQRSAYSDRHGIRFTANLFVVSRRRWQAPGNRVGIQGLEPVDGFYRDTEALARLSMLASQEDIDVWWRLSPASDLADLAAFFIFTVTTYGLPWMDAREQADDDDSTTSPKGSLT